MKSKKFLEESKDKHIVDSNAYEDDFLKSSGLVVESVS